MPTHGLVCWRICARNRSGFLRFQKSVEPAKPALRKSGIMELLPRACGANRKLRAGIQLEVIATLNIH